MPLTKDKKAELIGKYGRAGDDTGSAEVQVALLTERINELTEHLRSHTQGPPLAARAAEDGRQAPPPAALPREQRPRALPLAGLRARPPPLAGGERTVDQSRAPTPPTSPCPTRTGTRSASRTSPARRLVLAFYPGDFSPVCTDQLWSTRRSCGEIECRGGPGRDQRRLHLLPRAFREQLGLTMPLLADFHPKGEVTAAYGAYRGAGPRQPLARAGRRGRERRLGPRVADTARDPRREPDLRRARR